MITNNYAAKLNSRQENFFSEDFTGLLINSVGGYISPERLELFLKKLKKEASKYIFDSETEANLIRVTSSLFDKVSFINEALKYPHHLEILTAIVSNSNFLTDIIVQNPGLLYQIYDSEYLNSTPDAAELEKEINLGIAPYKSFNSRVNYLKQFKKRYILKTGIKDILGFSPLAETTSSLSALASALLSSLFEICLIEIETKYKAPLSRSFCLASLGKQGGNELNYSSDVDLILFYEKDYLPEGEHKREYYELLNEALLLFIKSSTEISEKGYLYRIDFRLRPDGGHSPLCRTINDYMNYYEARGENWERQMLLKLGFVCGSRNLFDSFYRHIRGFIFPPYFSSPVKEQVKKIKNEIERKIEGAENIKLFQGGIRDIEFTVQVLQLLNGRTLKELRNGNTLNSIGLLQTHKLLSNKEADTFTNAYIFYRKTEHFLQLMNDRQTHLLPSGREQRIKLARYLKLKDENELDERINIYREKVRKIFKHILKPDSGEFKEGIGSIAFNDKPRAVKNLKFLQSGTGILGSKEFDSTTIEKFKNLEEQLFNYLSAEAEPDKVLENFTRIIRSTKLPSLWYAQFGDRKFFKSFLNICAHSQIAADMISSGAEAGDYFLSGDCFKWNEGNVKERGSFTELLLTLSALHALDKIKENKFSRLISESIDSRIALSSAEFTGNYFIAALGSYGSSEMNFASDIDFLFVAEDKSDIHKAEKECEALIKNLNKETGFFNVDLRLRPEGKSSQLVRTISSYGKYLETRARVWEFQSLAKLRFVWGNKNLFNLFARKLVNRVAALEHGTVRKEITEMHSAFTRRGVLESSGVSDLKKSKGGFTTIEFALQYLLISNPSIYRKCLGKPVPFVIKKLKENEIFPGEMELLLINYTSMKEILLRNQNSTGVRNYKLDDNSPQRRQIDTIYNMNINIFNKILES